MYWPDTQTELKPLKSVTRLNPESLSETTNPDFRFDYIDIGSVVYGKGITTKQSVTFSDAPSRARKLVRENDLIISTVRTYLRAIARIGPEDDKNIASTGFAVCRPVPGVDPTFLFYAVHSQPFIEEVVARSTGISYPAINPSTLGDIKLPVPSEDEQVAIANFLDRETNRIDGLIEKKTWFIALLKEKRAAVITHAVTKGLSRINGRKESDAANNLEDARLDQIFYEVTNLVPLDGIELLTPSVVHGVVPQASLGMRPQQALRENYRVNLAQPDDFVISLSSHAHGIEYCGLEGGVSPDYTLLRPKCDPRLIPFLKYALKSGWIIFQMGAFKTGVRMGLRLTWNKVRYCKIGLPSPEIAERIADYLDGETSRIDGLITLTERSIDLLREKRAALITAAVTGKIDVRAAA